MVEILFDLAGLFYRTESQKQVVYDLQIGDELKIKPDILNGNDDFALKIYSKGKFIGFVPKYLSREITFLLWRYKNYILEVDDYNSSTNILYGDEEYCLTLKLSIDKSNAIQFSDEWYADKNFIIEGVFNQTNKSDITYFIQKHNGIVKKVLTNSIDAVILGRHHISVTRMNNIYKFTKQKLIIISEEEIIQHFEKIY